MYRVGPNYFLLTKNKAGELHRITKKTYRKTHARYLALQKIGKEKETSQYSPRHWPGCHCLPLPSCHSLAIFRHATKSMTLHGEALDEEATPKIEL